MPRLFVSGGDVADDDFDGLEAFLPDLLSDDAIPTNGIVVVEYLTPEGETEHAYVVLGDTRIVHAIGLLEVGKLLVWDDGSGEEDD
jgi:hypothetical protein